MYSIEHLHLSKLWKSLFTVFGVNVKKFYLALNAIALTTLSHSSIKLFTIHMDWIWSFWCSHLLIFITKLQSVWFVTGAYILYIFGLTHYAIVHLLLKPVNQSSWRSKKMFSGNRLFTVELHSVYWLVSISSVLTLEVIQVTYQKYLWNQRVLKLYVPII